jgi:tetratricopeptide (TPR) repeat protein
MPVWVAAAAIVLLTCLAYLNSFTGDFVFDDIPEIASNPALDRLWPPWGPMFGGENPARPLPYYSFAVDRGLWGSGTFGYHLTNLVVHLIAAVALFDLTRLTLLSPRLRNRWGSRAVSLALIIAGLWAVHPLQTQAVTYVYQRIESMAGMFCLLSLAAFARAMAAGWSRKWLVASVAACAAAMACKENAVVLPVLLVLYDWFFAPADTPAAWRADVLRRGGFHAACFLTWIILAAVILLQAREYQEFGASQRSPLTYALTQPGVILHYLRLAILPLGQCFDHSGWPAVERFEAGQLPAYLAIGAVAGLSLFGTVRRQPWAWLGMFFLGTLAPTSSVMPVEAFANEHRMYLPLAAVLATLVLGVAELGPRLGPRLGSQLGSRMLRGAANHEATLSRAGMVTAAVIAIVLVGLTHARNNVYRSGTAVWMDVLEHDPDNYRALWQLAVKLDWLGNEQDAFAMADRALDGKPSCEVYADLARAKLSAGDYQAAERRFRRGLERQRDALPADSRAVFSATNDLATALHLAGRVEEATDLSEAAIADMRRVLGVDDTITLRAEQFIAEGLAKRGDHAAAEELARAALHQARLARTAGDPIAVAGAISLSRVLSEASQAAEAEQIVTRAIDDLSHLGPRREGERLVLEDLRAELLEKEDRFDEAVDVRRRIASTYERLQGRDSPLTASAIDKHALALAAQATARGDHAQAVEIYGRMVEKYRAGLGADHPDTRGMAAKWQARMEQARMEQARMEQAR